MEGPSPRSPGRAPLSRRDWFGLAVAVLALTTVVALWQVAGDSPPPAPAMGWRWFFEPLQLNPALRLPAIDADLLDVAALDEQRVWAVGRRGTVVASDNGGATWNRQEVVVAPLPAATPPPVPAKPGPTGAFKLPAPDAAFPRWASLMSWVGPRQAHAQEAPPPNSPAVQGPADDPYPKDDKKDDKQDLLARQAAETERRNQEKKAKEKEHQKEQQKKQEKTQENRANQRPPAVPPTGNPTPPPNQTNRLPTLPAAVPVLADVNGVVLLAVWVGRGEGTDAKVVGEALSDDAQRFQMDGRGRWIWRGPLSFAAGRAVERPLRTAQYLGRSWRVVDANGRMTEHPDSRTPLPFDGVAVDALHVDEAGRTAILTGGSVRLDGEAESARFGRAGATPNARDLFVGFSEKAGGPVWTVGDGDDRGDNIHIANSDKDRRPQHRGGPALNSITFLPGAPIGWAVGDRGVVLSTRNGGERWVALTRDAAIKASAVGAYARLPAPWYAAAWAVVVFLLVQGARRRPAEQPTPQSSVADEWTSDRPLEPGAPDPLGFGRIALGLSSFLRNENTLAPLTIAVTGEWGTGKSSLMNLLRANLTSYGFRPVWFNAWHHQKEEHLLASLLQAVRMQAVPAWVSAEGPSFRLRLLWIRSKRNAVFTVLMLAMVAAFVAFELNHQHGKGGLMGIGSELVTALKHVGQLGAEKAEGGGDKTAAVAAAPVDKSQAALAVSLLVTLIGVWRGFKPFGISPASLLGTAAGALKLRDLDAQTSFRQKFATEFEDVTTSLGDRPMIIFVDDLDRCRPSQVLDVLEAINFLVSSGQCFVVMGMARTRVEPAIALSFKEIAEEMTREEQTAEGGVTTPTEETRKLRRALYARQYLDKLINIEIPVPAPTNEQAQALLEAPRLAPRGREATTARRLRWARRLVPLTIPLAFAVVGAVAGTWLAGFAGENVTSEATATDSAPGASKPAQAAQTTNGGTRARGETGEAGGNAPASQQTDARTQRGRRPAAAATPNQTGQVLPSRVFPPSATAVGIAALGLLVVAGALALVVRRRPDLVVKDSDEFAQALRTWHPLIFQAHPTPRALKRFRNHVRYLAMLQRPAPRSAGWWGRFLAAFTGPPRTAADDEAPSAPAASATPIPERVLVALAALDDARPGWRKDAALGDDPVLGRILSAGATLGDLLKHGDAFRRAASGVSVR